MTEPTTDFAPFAGLVLFPPAASSLRSTTICPACFTPLTSTICANCALDLNHPAAAQLVAASAATAEAFDRRLAIIGQIRYETAQRRASLAATTLTSPTPPSTRPTPPATSPLPALPALPARTIPPAAPAFGTTRGSAAVSAMPAPPVQRRSSVQIVMLVVGVGLLSIAAIFFLVYAFFVYGLLVQTVVVASLTVAAFWVASLLRRKNLGSTAEGIAAFAVVLTYLDAWALRDKGFFGLGDTVGAVYWGAVLMCSAVAFVIWNRWASLRVASLVGFSVFAPGVGLLVAGLADDLDPVLRTFVALAGASIAALVHPFATRVMAPGTDPSSRVVEQVLALATGVFGLVCALSVAFFVDPANEWAAALALLCIAAIALCHVVVATRTSDDAEFRQPPALTHLAAVFGGLGGVAAAATGTAVALRTADQPTALQFWPVVAATAAALALELVARRIPRSTRAVACRVAGWSAGGIALLAMLIPLSTAVLLAAGTALAATPAAGRLDPARGGGGTDIVATPGFEVIIAVVALATVTLMAATSWAASGILAARRELIVWAVAAIAVLAVPLLGTAWGVTAGWLAVSAAGLALTLLRTNHQELPVTLRRPVLAAVLGSTALAWCVSWVSAETWWWGSLATIAVLLVARATLRNDSPIGRAALVGTATIVALVAAGGLARQLEGELLVSASLSFDWLRFVGILATGLVIATGGTIVPTLAARDRRVIFWISGPVAAVTAFSTFGMITAQGAFDSDRAGAKLAPLLAEPITSLVLSLALLAGLLTWAAHSSNTALRAERAAASLAIAPTVYAVVSSFARTIGVPEVLQSVAPITAALLVSAGTLALTVLRRAPVASVPSGTSAASVRRWAREAGIAVVALPAVFVAVADKTEATWLVLLLAGITALLVAVSADGLFASASPRKHLGWLALGFATAGLWWRLAGDNILALEPYVLPLAGALLTLALLMWRSSRRHSGSESTTAPLIALAGLLVGVLPLAVNAADGELVRAAGVGLASGALLLVGTVRIGTLVDVTPQLRPYLDGAALAGAIGVITTGVGRAAFLTRESSGHSGPALEAWLGAAFLLLVAAAFGLAMPRGGTREAPATGFPRPVDFAWHNAAAARRERIALGSTAALRGAAAQVLGVIAMSAVLVLEALNFDGTPVGQLRVVAVVLLFSAIHVLASATERPPFTAVVGWFAIACAGFAAAAGIVLSAVDPIEIATLPIALALLASGLILLDRLPTARSWPCLGPAVAVLLLPSLVATATDRPLWRLVSLGVVAVAVLVIGATRRLQAPFVLGAVVAAVHGVGTFSSEIRVVYEAVPWWLWLGVGGVLLIVLAARYEQRIQDLRSVALRITALR